MKKLFYVLLLSSSQFIFFNNYALANVDSLLKIWNDHSQHDTVRLNAMRVIAWDNYIFKDPDSAFYFAQKLYSFAKKKNNKKFMADALNTQGASFYFKGDYTTAIDYYSKSIKLREEIGDKKGWAATLVNMGNIYRIQGDYKKAIDHLTKSLKISEEIDNNYSLMGALASIGNIYADQKDYDKALNYFTRSLKVSEEIGNKHGITNALNNIGTIYNYQGDKDKAISYYIQCLKIREEMGDKNGIASALSNIGGIYFDKGENTKALDYFNQSLQLKEEIGDKQGKSNSLTNIGLIYYKQGNYNVALEYAQKALIITQEVGDAYEKHLAAKSLWEIYKKLGKNKEAMEMFELYISTRDTLQSEENQRAVIQQEYQYNYEKQFIEDSLAFIQEQEVKQVEHQAELDKEAQQRYILYGGLGFLLLLGGFAFRGYQRKKKDNAVITEQKQIVEEAHKEIKDSINYAERIQRSFLASKELLDVSLGKPASGGAGYFVFFQPKDVVSGDFYWASVLPNENFALCCADSTGHGVPGAIMSILNISSLEKSIETEIEPHRILNKTREIIIERLKKDGSSEGGKDGMDCSLLILNQERTKITYAAANNPVWIIRDKKLIELKPDKMPVGKHDKDQLSFTQHEFDLQKGDLIYSLTDGMPDQFGGPKAKKYKYVQLKEFLVSISDCSMEEQHQKLKTEFENWKGNLEQVDDVCIIGVKI